MFQLFGTVLALLLIGCGESSQQPSTRTTAAQTKWKQEQEQKRVAQEVEKQLMADTNAALLEIENRIRKALTRDNGLLIIRHGEGGRWFSISAIAATAPWEIRCKRTGLELAFGATVEVEVSDGAGEISNALVVRLTNAQLSEQQCTQLVPSVGQLVLILLR